MPATRIPLLLAGLALLGLLPAPAASAADEPQPTLGLRYPSLTPDNASVTFAYRGDIWVAPVDGQGPARRLTIHEAQDTLPRVSPDGTQVAFSSRRNGGYDIFVMPLAGGVPRQVTFHSGGELMCEWSPDGKRILFFGQRHPTFYGLDLYEVDLEGGTPRRITREGGRDGAYGPDGQIAYARGFNDIYHDDYEGSANFDIHVVGEPGGIPRRLTRGAGNERYPFFSADGATIWFVAEREGVANFYAVNADGSGEVRQVTAFEEDVRRPDLAWDGKTVVFEIGGRLARTDLTAESPEPRPIPLVVASDVRHSGVEVRTVSSGAQHVHVSHDGTRLVFSARGDLWTMAAGGGDATRLTETDAAEEWPRWSPDGRKIAYQSDAGGDSNIYVLDVPTRSSERVIGHKANDFFHAWSPDGTKIVFSSERSGNRDIWIHDLTTGRETQVTNHPAADDDPVFSPDGRWIAFDSGREGAQAIFVIPAEGGEARRVSGGSGFMQVPSFSPDGSLLVFEAFNPSTGGSGGLYVISVHGGPQEQISRDGSAACWSARGDYVYFTRGRRGDEQVYRLPAPTSVEPGERVPFRGRVQVDLREELGSLFDEAWERLRDGFYDPKMHGVDWQKLRDFYRPMAVDAENKDEFQNVIRQLLAELGASHLGIRGGYRPAHMATPDVPETGYLGLEFDPEPAEGGGRRVASVFPGGPADAAGLRVGDVVLAVGNTRLRPNTNLDVVLAGTVGQAQAVTFRPITAEGLGTERRVEVTPSALDPLFRANYRRWVEHRARIVKEQTQGQIGYVHLLQMNGENLQRFRRAVERWIRDDRVKGMVLDIRFNGGGNIHVPLMDILMARPYAYVQPRGEQRRITQPQIYWNRPVVVLINERSFSDAEVFPYIFRAAGRGQLVGVPTPGGVIGTTDVTLSDGSVLRIPRVGYYTLDGENLEGHGVEPDVLVVETPEDLRAGRDPQLLKAIEVVMEEVKAREAAAAEPPAPPAEEPPPATPPTAPPEPPDRPPPATVDAHDPLADVEPGEWVRYRVALGGEETVLRFVVTEVTPTEVRFATEVERRGAFLPPLPEALERRPILESLPLLGEVVAHATARSTVEGRAASVLLATVRWGEAPVELVFTNAVPALGLLRAEMDGEVVMEAVAWGPPAPPAAEPPASSATAPAPPAASAPQVPETDAGTGEGIADPLYDAEVGEWTRHWALVRNRRGGGDATVRVELTARVVEVTQEEVVLATAIRQGEEEVQGPAVRRPRRPTLERGELLRRETVTVAGRTLDCLVVRSTGRRGGETLRWICPEVPVSGVVRVAREGTVVRELVEWGRD